MRNTFSKVFYEAGKDDQRLCVVVADISPAGSIQDFAKDFPDRFVNVGVAEQIMIGMCAGMALRGLRPFAYTIAPFTIFRPYEHVRDDLCYQNLPVTIVGIGGGVSYSALGSTHHAMEDIALCNGLPNMQAIAPCDSLEVQAATRWCTDHNANPCYLRLSRVGDEPLTEGMDEPWQFGKVRRLQTGEDTAIVAYGPILKMAFEVADGLRGDGRSVSVYSCSTIKPLDRDGLGDVLKRHKHVAVIEEMVPSASLGALAKQLAWDIGASCRLDTFSLQDRFIHMYGDHGDVLSAHGLSTDRILTDMRAA